MVAAFYGLPAKDWQACYRAKNKLVMRQTIQDAGLDNVWFRPVYQREELQASDIPFPCIVKPVEGVASENVALVSNVQELQQHADRFWQKVPGQPLLLEEYLEGSLHTLETLGDGQQIQVMGSFETFLSEPPCFIELEQRFSREPARGVSEVLLAQLKALGVGFGTCHTEFVMTDKGPRLIEVNYRNIGDQSDFLMAQALGFNLFGAVIDLYMGHAAAELPSGSQSAYIYCQVAEQSGIIHQVPVAQQLEKEGCQISFEPLCKAGDFHQQDFSNRDYLSILRATGPSEQILMPVVQHFIQELKIQFTTDLSDTALNAEEAVA
nr:ATP-grasp domain-containing protein [Oceanospirillum sediminis]